MNQWICYGLVCDNEKGKIIKIPKNPHNGYNASCNNKESWSDYNTAVNAVKRYGFNGFGFELDNGIVGVDLDDALDENGKLTKDADDIVEALDSYTEISPSGKGLHIFCKGKLPPGRRRKGNIEMYSSNRFFTVTGNIYGQNREIEERSYQLGIVHKAYLCDEDQEPAKNMDSDKKASQEPQIKSWITDSEIIEKASNAKNGDLFKSLWSGNYGNYKSKSEADQALCNILAFYCGNDFNRIDSLFRRSGLYREKWDRVDYKNRTINKAISGCRNTFHCRERPDNKILNQYNQKVTPYYINKKTLKNTGEIRFTVNCPLLSKYIRENNDYLFVIDETNSAVMRYWYKDGYYRLFNDDMIKGIIKGHITSFNEEILKMNDVKEVFNDLITDLKTISQDNLNTDENIINLQNGILNLKSTQLLPHSPKYYSTIQIPCN